MRGRRAASNLAMLTALVMLAATVLVGWARVRQAAPYRVALPWINVPVSVGGQAIEPGDAVLCDESGVVVLKPNVAEAYAKRAIEMQARELVLLERLRKGEWLPDISGATAHVEGKLAKN